jgi:hypothetical protein
VVLAVGAALNQRLTRSAEDEDRERAVQLRLQVHLQLVRAPHFTIGIVYQHDLLGHRRRTPRVHHRANWRWSRACNRRPARADPRRVGLRSYQASGSSPIDVDLHSRGRLAPIDRASGAR